MKNLFLRTANNRSRALAANHIRSIMPPANLMPSIVTDQSRSLTNRGASLIPSSNPSIGMKRYYSNGGVEGGQKNQPKVSVNDLEITTLKPDSEDDFQTFKTIITNEKVVFTSSWVDQYFGIATLKDFCADFETQLKLASKGRHGVVVAPKDLKNYQDGKLSATQIALNNFFSEGIDDNDTKLRAAYKQITSEAESGLGYYKVVDKNSGKFVGGGALAPLEKDEISGKVTKVDVALHILEAKKGIGTACLAKLLKSAFEDHKITQVWGSSVIDHPGTPTLCASQGMMIKNVGDKKYYLMTEQMWEAAKKPLEIMNTGVISAAQQIFTPKGGRTNS
jgi:hypothetical protein